MLGTLFGFSSIKFWLVLIGFVILTIWLMWGSKFADPKYTDFETLLPSSDVDLDPETMETIKLMNIIKGRDDSDDLDDLDRRRRKKQRHGQQSRTNHKDDDRNSDRDDGRDSDRDDDRNSDRDDNRYNDKDNDRYNRYSDRYNNRDNDRDDDRDGDRDDSRDSDESEIRSTKTDRQNRFDRQEIVVDKGKERDQNVVGDVIENVDNSESSRRNEDGDVSLDSSQSTTNRFFMNSPPRPIESKEIKTAEVSAAVENPGAAKKREKRCREIIESIYGKP